MSRGSISQQHTDRAFNAPFGLYQGKLGVVVIRGANGWMLPGGRKDQTDRDQQFTALRETFEETGVKFPKNILKNLTLNGQFCPHLFYTEGFMDMKHFASAFPTRQSKNESDALGIVFLNQPSKSLSVTVVGRDKSVVNFSGMSPQKFRGGTAAPILELQKQISTKSLGKLKEIFPQQRSTQQSSTQQSSTQQSSIQHSSRVQQPVGMVADSYHLEVVLNGKAYCVTQSVTHQTKPCSLTQVLKQVCFQTNLYQFLVSCGFRLAPNLPNISGSLISVRIVKNLNSSGTLQVRESTLEFYYNGF